MAEILHVIFDWIVATVRGFAYVMFWVGAVIWMMTGDQYLKAPGK